MPKLSERTRFGSVFCCIALVRPAPSRTRRVRKGSPFRWAPLYRDSGRSPNRMWQCRAPAKMGLQVERGLDLAELVELGLGAVAHGVIGRVGHVLLGVLDGLRKLGRVELDEVNGRLGENGEARRRDFGEAAAHEIALMLAAAGKADIEQPWLERREQRGVMGEHGHLAL